MVRKKTVPRVRATPRLIRDIKPKRQLPRGQCDDGDGDDDWWQANSNRESSTTLKSTGDCAASPFLDGETDSTTDQFDDGNIGERVDWNQLLWDVLERYKRTPRLKKLKQIFWGLILIKTLKLIYQIDLDGYSSSKRQSTDIYDASRMSNQPPIVNVKPLSKGFFSNEGFSESVLYSPKYVSSGSGLRGSTLDESNRLAQPNSNPTSKSFFFKDEKPADVLFSPQFSGGYDFNSGSGLVSQKNYESLSQIQLGLGNREQQKPIWGTNEVFPNQRMNRPKMPFGGSQ